MLLRAPSPAGAALVACSLAAALVAATFGFLVIGLGTGTDCETWYPCYGDGCSPCERVAITAGAQTAAQVVLAGVAVVALARGRASVLLGLLLPHLVVGCFLVATATAQASYCRPGTEGYAESYCPGAPGPVEERLTRPGSGSASPPG